MPFDAERMKGVKATVDMIDADTGEVAIEAGKKLTVRSARQLAEKGLKALRAGDADLYGQYIAEDLYNPETGEIFAEAGDEITEKSLARCSRRASTSCRSSTSTTSTSAPTSATR